MIQCFEPKLTSEGFRLKARLCKPKRPEAAVLFVHGLCSDHKEIGIFTRIEKRLLELGCITLRFDFRGHGESMGEPDDMSIKGELEDLENAFQLLQKQSKGKEIGLVAASFGASIFLLSKPRKLRIKTAVLLNPVINFHRTFLEPETTWGYQYFGRDKIIEGNPIFIEGCVIGRQLVQDLTRFEPYECVQKWNIPLFIIHGDRDKVVPYATSRELCLLRNNVFLSTIPGADHGFDNAEKRRLVIELTKQWFYSRLLER